MDIKDLNKAQLLLLALLLCFITSVATGITVVSLMDQAPTSITTPINKIVKQTVEKVVPIETPVSALTDEDKALLEELKSIKSLGASLYLEDETEDTLLASGLMLGENKMIINSVVPAPKEGEVYVVHNILGQKKVMKITALDGYTLVEINKEVLNNNPEQNATTQ